MLDVRRSNFTIGSEYFVTRLALFFKLFFLSFNLKGKVPVPLGAGSNIAGLDRCEWILFHLYLIRLDHSRSTFQFDAVLYIRETIFYYGQSV